MVRVRARVRVRGEGEGEDEDESSRRLLPRNKSVAARVTAVQQWINMRQ